MRESGRRHPAARSGRFDTLLSAWITAAMVGLCGLAILLLVT